MGKTASTTTWPTARWSAWFTHSLFTNRTVGSWVMTTWGRCRRMARVICSRRVDGRLHARVRLVEEVDREDADLGRGGPLLRLATATELLRLGGRVVRSLVPAGHHQVARPRCLRRPSARRGRRHRTRCRRDARRRPDRRSGVGSWSRAISCALSVWRGESRFTRASRVGSRCSAAQCADSGVVGEEHHLAVTTQVVEQAQQRVPTTVVGLGSDLVQEQRGRLAGGDQVLGEGHPEEEVHLLARALGQASCLAPLAGGRLLDLDSQVPRVDRRVGVAAVGDARQRGRTASFSTGARSR